jgi:phosphoribosyl 1,2-cyclic phosphate phosphodiesterase
VSAGRLTFLGTGTSHGVPMIGCTCAVCRSDDPRDRRWRPSVWLDLPGIAVLVDTSTDLRSQALQFRVPRVDAILFTHSHADHVMGLDEVRRFNALQGAAVPCFADPHTAEEIRRTFAYIFARRPASGGGLPQVDLFDVAGEFCLGRHLVTPVPLLHGRRLVLGYRVGGLAYLTDCSEIPEASFELLQGLDVLVIDALRDRPHPTHFTVSQALDVVERVRPTRAYFTHIAHDLPHAETCARLLPRGAELAYDGLILDFPI